MLMTENGNGTATVPATEPKEHRNGGPALRESLHGRLLYRSEVPAPVGPPLADDARARQAVALFCYEAPGGAVGQFLTRVADGLAGRGLDLHLFSRRGFEISAPGAFIHVLGESTGDLLEQVQEFNHRACNAFLRHFPNGSGPVSLLGFEWSSVPVLSLLHGIKGHDAVLSLSSLERQRSDLTSDLSRRIEEIERTGLREAKAVLVPDGGTAAVASLWEPSCADRVVAARHLFPAEGFRSGVDAGTVKARYQIGPVDPTILYVGDLDERYGPDLLMKSFPTVLKAFPQARMIVVGDGTLHWPLRVYARYLLLEHAVRFAGNVEGQAMRELMQAADVVVVPSREPTPWWPILAAWAAERPVVTTHEAAPGLMAHEQDGLLCHASTHGLGGGINAIFADAGRAGMLGRNGYRTLDSRFGWNAVAAQIEELIGVRASV